MSTVLSKSASILSRRTFVLGHIRSMNSYHTYNINKYNGRAWNCFFAGALTSPAFGLIDFVEYKYALIVPVVLSVSCVYNFHKEKSFYYKLLKLNVFETNIKTASDELFEERFPSTSKLEFTDDYLHV